MFMIDLKVINPSAKLIDVNALCNKYDVQDYPTCYYVMEHIGRVCYNSENKGYTAVTMEKFLSSGAKRGHRSIFEFGQLHFSVELDSNNFDMAYDLVKPNKYCDITSTPLTDGDRIGTYILNIKGSPRALIEILENIVADGDTDTSMPFFKALYDALHDIIPVVLLNWESIDSIDNHYNSIDCFLDYEVAHYINDITGVYDSRHQFTKYLFMIQCSRSESHEIVRHRPASLMQSSQRYIRYNEDNPYTICLGTEQQELIGKDVIKFAKKAFKQYTKLLKGNKAENARVVLPNCTETKVFIYCDKTEYAHLDRMRTSVFAYPPVKEAFDSVHGQLINKKYV